MPALASADLTEVERRTLARLVAALDERLGDDLRAVWLYGSRARGRRSGPESDVDLLVVARTARFDDVHRIGYEIAVATGMGPSFLSYTVWTPEYVENRREIRSFFMQEVDRDRIVLLERP